MEEWGEMSLTGGAMIEAAQLYPLWKWIFISDSWKTLKGTKLEYTKPEGREEDSWNK